MYASVSGYSFSATLHPYVALSGATTVALSPGDDDVLSAALPIGFSFVYDGLSYTQFKVSSNGFLTFNTAQTSSLPANQLSSNVLALAPLWDDLGVDATGKVHYQLSGSAPFRVLTVEFLKMRWSKFAAGPTANFQVVLYEGSNVIEFRYGLFATPDFPTASIGISDILANNASSTYSASHFLSVTPGAGVSSSVENTAVTALPEYGSGTVYSFTPPVPVAVPLLTIGASGSYTTLQAACNDLRARGIANDVTLKIMGDYVPESPSGGIAIDYIPGMGPSRRVAIVLEPGVSKTITVANSTNVDYTIRLRGVRSLSIDGSAGTLRFVNTGTNASSALKLMDGVQNCSFRSLTLQAEGSTTTTANGVVFFGAANTSNNINLTNSADTLARCTITKATLRCANGIVFSATAASPLNDGNRVDSCTIADWGVGTGVAQAGIVLGRGYANTTLADNDIGMTANVPSYGTQASLLLGIFANDASTSFSILRNQIHDILPNTAVTTPTIRGIRVFQNSASPASLVANNMVTLDAVVTTTLASGGSLYGISDEAAGVTSYSYNSVRIGGTQSSGSGGTAAFDRQATGTTTLRNNVLYNARSNSGSGSGKHYALKRGSPTGTFSSDRNDLFVDGAGGLIGFTGADQATIAAWRTATGQDGTSIAVNPQYTSAVDLHLQATSPAESKATPLAPVTTDKDGAARDATWPDIGADEFAGPAPGSFTLSLPANNATGQPVSGTLRWSSAAAAGGYEVILDTASNPSTVVSANQYDTSYTFANLASGTRYYWRVRARNAAGQSLPAVTPFSFTVGSVPAAPTGLAVSALANASVGLAWTDNATTETGYRVYRATAAAGPFAQVGTDLAAGSVAYTNTGLTASTRYYYRVVAFNAAGESYFTATDTTTLPTTPNAPSFGTVLFTSLVVVVDSTANATTTQFALLETGTNLYVQANGTLGADAVWQTVGQWGRAAGTTVTGLARSAAYTFRVKARNLNLAETPLGSPATTTTATPIAAYPYTADFEGTSDSLWTTAKNPSLAIPSPANDWVRGTFTKLGGASSGTKAWVTKLTGTYSPNHLASLVSPEFNFSAFTRAPKLSFFHSMKAEQYQDAGVVEYTTDGGSSWSRLGATNDTDGTNWYTNDSTGPGAPVSAPNWTNTTSGWKNATYVPGVLAGKPVVQFRFRFGTDIFNADTGWAVDKFQVIPPVNKDIRVMSVSVSEPRMVNYPLTVTAKIRNLGAEANPVSVPLTYKKTTAPTSFGDVGGVGQTFTPAWSGDSATVTFTTPFSPTATGALKMYVRAFYSGDQLATNDSANTTVTVNQEGLYFAEDFESTTFPPAGWSRVDANADGFTWGRSTTAPYTGSGHAAYSYNTNNISVGGDDWLFTLPVDLDAARAYSIIFQYRVKSAAYPERMEVTIGNQATPAAQTTRLLDLPSLTNTAYKQGAQSFAVASSGTYYIGFHCYSNPFEWALYIDSVRMRLTNNFDLAMNSLQQVDGLVAAAAPASAGKPSPGIFLLDGAKDPARLHTEEIAPAPGAAVVAATPDVNASLLAVPMAGGRITKPLVRSTSTFPAAPIPPSIALRAAVANLGSNNVASYGINWSVGGASQIPYAGGAIARFSGIDSATLSYAPPGRGTFYAQAQSVLGSDNNRANDSTTTRARVYPLVSSMLRYDLGGAAAQLRAGYDRAPGQSVTAGVRYTTTEDVKLANVDVFYTNKNNTGDTFQSQDSVQVRVWAAGASDSAPGALLYTRRFAGTNYITTNPSGEAFSLPLGDDAPAFVAGTSYWVSVSFDSLIRYPMGADEKTTGRSFISPDKGATWTKLLVDPGTGLTEYAWWLRCVSIPLGTISGTKFDDTNGNGARDPGEPALPGWTINITGPASGSAVTDSAGNYSFTNLDGGTYVVTETQQSGWRQTLPASPGSYTVAIAVGGPTNGRDFGNFRLGSVAGALYNDQNANGARDGGESGLAGRRVFLVRGGAVVDSATTDGSGNYQFPGLVAGAYTVRAASVSGWIQTAPPSQGDHVATIVSGSAVTGKDFGAVQASGIAGILFHDLNANGVRDSADAGLPAWRLWLSVNGLHADSTMTDAGGAYVFSGLADGTFAVRESLQAGWIQSLPDSMLPQTVTLAGGASASGRNFGVYRRGSIAGVVFNDRNGNGAIDGGEPPLSSWRVRLTGARLDSVLTDSAGGYRFSDLTPGNYTLSLLLQGGWGQSVPVAPATFAVTVTSGADIAGKNFGTYRFSSITGSSFNDLDGDGAWDAGEPVVAGWLIRLSGAQSGSQSTDTSGRFTFSNLRPGSYTVSEVTRSTWDQTFPAGPGTHALTITDASTVSAIDFGNFQHASIAGTIFNDLDADASRDSAESGLAGWMVRLRKNGADIDSVVTGLAGTYAFTGLSVGTYAVRESLQAGWTLSSASELLVPVASGAAVTGKDFGNYQRGTIAGRAFNDQNANGVREIGEAGLAGWRIRLSNGGTQLDSVLTDSAGNYSLLNVAPGSYQLTEAAQAGWTLTAPSTPGAHNVTITGGAALSGYDFGNFSLSGFSGIIFEDLNGNAVRDGGEPLVTGLRVRLFKDGVRVDSALTDTAGRYTFSGLAAGTYVVAEVVASGWGASLPGATASYTVVITSGVSVPSRDFGNFRYSTLSGQAFADMAGDGTKDAGDPGIAGWRIRLYRGAQLADSLLTAAGGTYAFTNVVPGVYTITEVVQAGWIQTVPAAPGTYGLTVTSGTVAAANHFGDFQLGSISGIRFEDTDANGLQDGADTGTVGWRIRLSLNGSPVDSVLTGPSGGFSFAGIRPGSYVVSQAAAAGWGQSAPPAAGTFTGSMTSGAAIAGLRFGAFRFGAIAGRAFHDHDGDSVRDPEDEGAGGWRIRLLKNGTQLDSVLTDAAGTFAFGTLVPGSYAIREESRAGWAQTLPASPSGYPVTIGSGVSDTGRQFGNFQYGSIAGTVFLDADGGGVKLPGSGLPGRRVRLSRNGTPVDSILTDASGAYAFAGLSAGSYLVSVALPAGWIGTLPGGGTYAIVVVSGTASVNADFGNFQLGTIAGTAFVDNNGDGTRNGGEAGLAGWRIILERGGAPVDSLLTDGSGSYLFPALVAGTYTVREVVQPGWLQTLPVAPGTYTVTVTSGTTATARDFGTNQPGSIAGTKFEDLNGNGAKDGGEPGIASWSIRITGPVEASTLTDATGHYAFVNLVPGSYVVSETPRSGWLQTAPPAGTHPVALTSAAAVAGKDFGNFNLGTASGSAFDDRNGDGVRDPGEPGLAGWRIRLSLGAAPVDSALTDATGSFAFSGLAAGSYTLSVVLPAGWTQSAPAAPGTRLLTVTSGSGSTANDFGAYRHAGIGGTLYNDTNGNGVRDGIETGASGWRIRLWRNAAVVDSLLTNGAGAYHFSALIAGTYVVTSEDRSGWSRTSAPAAPSFIVAAGADTLGNDIGVFHLGVITGVVYEDSNATGTREGGEPGLQNWRLVLSLGGTPVDSVLSDENGAFAFPGLAAGTYVLTERRKSAWTLTTAATRTVNVVSGTVSTGNDFGNRQTGVETDMILELTALLEGFYDPGTDTMVPDTVTVRLHNVASPYGLVEAKTVVLNSAGRGTAIFHIPVEGTPYYVVVEHRNAIETWSASGQAFIGAFLSYDFSSAASQAYGSNLVHKGVRWCIYSGDCEKDGWVDALDMNVIDNDAASFLFGYNRSDLNGDGWTDGLDMNIVDNNSSRFTYAVRPGTAAPAVRSDGAQRKSRPLPDKK